MRRAELRLPALAQESQEAGESHPRAEAGLRSSGLEGTEEGKLTVLGPLPSLILIPKGNNTDLCRTRNEHQETGNVDNQIINCRNTTNLKNFKNQVFSIMEKRVRRGEGSGHVLTFSRACSGPRSA